MRLILLAALLLQAAPAQSDADKMEAALKKFGERTYSIMMEGKKIGTAVLRTRMEKEKGRTVAIFEDQITIGEGEMALKMKETASLDRLRLLGAEGSTKEGDKNEKVSVTVDGKKAKITGRDPEIVVELTDAAVGEHGMLRMLCAAEQKVGASFKLDVLSLTAEELQPGHAFTCVAKEQIEIGGKKVDAFKWANKGEWKKTRKVGDQEVPATTTVDNTFWVSPDGYVLRSMNPEGMEVVLDAK